VPNSPTSIKVFRESYANWVLAKAGVDDERIRLAYASVELERYAGPGPWLLEAGGRYVSTGSDDPRLLYQDLPIGLMPERGINNGKPSLHAKCLAMAAPGVGDVVVHVGAGTGYYTAILGHLVTASGFVHAYEIEPELARRAASDLSHLGQVAVHAKSAVQPIPEAQAIYVNAGVTHPPDYWLDALAIGGRMILPLTSKDGSGCMLALTRRTPLTYAAGIFSRIGFIPCIGARDDQAAEALKAALDSGGIDQVRSLHRRSEPDETAWCVGSDWWLSTAEAAGGTRPTELRRRRSPISS
jgi:protein-L-isoaspartate(D-aspartate) O-methyltransferase